MKSLKQITADEYKRRYAMIDETYNRALENCDYALANGFDATKYRQQIGACERAFLTLAFQAEQSGVDIEAEFGIDEDYEDYDDYEDCEDCKDCENSQKNAAFETWKSQFDRCFFTDEEMLKVQGAYENGLSPYEAADAIIDGRFAKLCAKMREKMNWPVEPRR